MSTQPPKATLSLSLCLSLSLSLSLERSKILPNNTEDPITDIDGLAEEFEAVAGVALAL